VPDDLPDLRGGPDEKVRTEIARFTEVVIALFAAPSSEDPSHPVLVCLEMGYMVRGSSPT